MIGKVRTSWQRLLAKCGPLFLAQDSYPSVRLRRVAELSNAVRDYVLNRISCPGTGYLDAATARQFS